MPWVGRDSLGEVGDQADQQIGLELAASTKQSSALNGGRVFALMEQSACLPTAPMSCGVQMVEEEDNLR